LDAALQPPWRPGNENIVNGLLMCDQCHSIHLLPRSVANDFAATMERVEDALRE
jgi:hypothetical protein